MKNNSLKIQLLNLLPKGIAILVPFFKQIVCDPLNEEYTPVDGYQAAVLSMSLNTYIKISSLPDEELSTEQINFLESFNVILQDQEDVIELAFGEFSEFVDKYLTPGEDGEMFAKALFLDPNIYLK